MKIAVCIKRVPDTATRIKIGADGKSIVEDGVKFVLNPYDEYAIEEALQLKEKSGDGEVVAIAMGSDASRETIRGALAMGADRGILLQTDSVSLNPVTVAKVLAAELDGAGYDLILQLEGFLNGVFIVGIQNELDAVLQNRLSIGADLYTSRRVRDSFYAHRYLHRNSM